MSRASDVGQRRARQVELRDEGLLKSSEARMKIVSAAVAVDDGRGIALKWQRSASAAAAGPRGS